MEDAVDKVITICIAAGLGAILVGSFVLPVFSDMLGTLTTENYGSLEDLDTYKTLLGFVLIMVIVGFAIAIIRNASSRDR